MKFDKLLLKIMGVKAGTPTCLELLEGDGFTDTNLTPLVSNYRILRRGEHEVLYNIAEDRILSYNNRRGRGR